MNVFEYNRFIELGNSYLISRNLALATFVASSLPFPPLNPILLNVNESEHRPILFPPPPNPKFLIVLIEKFLYSYPLNIFAVGKIQVSFRDGGWVSAQISKPYCPIYFSRIFSTQTFVDFLDSPSQISLYSTWRICFRLIIEFPLH